MFNSHFSRFIGLKTIIFQAMGMAAETQFHVLAVDDSIIDRMLIERLLKTSSFHGAFLVYFLFVVFIIF